jgi:methylthioribose-1-phosphate isomerase
MPFPPLKFENAHLKLLDQRLLPKKEVWVSCRTSRDVHRAIKTMIVRGAPAIGVTAGYGLYLGIKNFSGSTSSFLKKLRAEGEYLKTARPTAVNLANVVDAIVKSLQKTRLEKAADLKEVVLAEARRAHLEDDRLCRTMGLHGSKLFKSGDRVLTHCNAGGLATSGYGTALGVIYAAVAAGKKISVYADETRPLLQGARLTAWELAKSKIPCTLLCDNMAASLMRAGKVDRIVVGADRIAANGDTANKIGTYNVAVLAKTHGIPFYVAAPRTTFDFQIKSGAQIPIENRADKEVTEGFGKRTAPHGIRVWNPAFDVTPQEWITAFITEAGVLRPPFAKSFKKLRAYGRIQADRKN